MMIIIIVIIEVWSLYSVLWLCSMFFIEVIRTAAWYFCSGWMLLCREIGYIPTNYIQLSSSSSLDQYEWVLLFLFIFHYTHIICLCWQYLKNNSARMPWSLRLGWNEEQRCAVRLYVGRVGLNGCLGLADESDWMKNVSVWTFVQPRSTSLTITFAACACRYKTCSACTGN